jgi:hypothetical protein
MYVPFKQLHILEAAYARIHIHALMCHEGIRWIQTAGDGITYRMGWKRNPSICCTKDRYQETLTVGIEVDKQEEFGFVGMEMERGLGVV